MWGDRNAGPCPKCGERSWFEDDDADVIQRCMCGLRKIVRTQQGDQTIVHLPNPKLVVLPKKDTKISKCLGILASYYPRLLSTGEMARLTGFSTINASTHLILLRQRGLVDLVNNKRGRAGGSQWGLTMKAVELLNLKR
ncbi:hypothetical protein LCGC14_0472180 [marine sediment metagenome]|uniref:Uncharacterized protein n=1 Tax=marine sediment metagenome TaxID=412755 RepID=A0A0F9UYV0_9ZZZZ